MWNGRPLADRQAIQFMIADSAMEIHSVRNMVYECAWRVDRGEDVRDLSYMVKVMATEWPAASSTARFKCTAVWA